jgi:A/G-specific adenine glycosylase
MLRGRELASFRGKLLGWFREYQRDLPWRRNKDPYRIWLSEIMLQQTRVAAVIPYFERFLERFPDGQALAAAPQDEVLRLWSGLGYYTRARNLQRAAQEIVAKHDGAFPRTYRDVLALSGIGGYTAAAILSIAFGAKYAVLDGNVARVVARLLAVEGDLREAGRWQKLQRAADSFLDRKFPGDWNQAVMELGATVCTPQSPQCLMCPVAQFCRARKLGIAESLPERRRKPKTVEVTLAAAVFVNSIGQTFLLPPGARPTKDSRHNDVATLVSRMWHFPMIAVRKNAAAELEKFLTALIKKSSRARSPQMQSLPKVRHTVTYRRVTALPFRVCVPQLPSTPGAKICSLDELVSASSLAISNLTRKIARAAVISDASEASGSALKAAEPVLFAHESPQSAS